MTTFQSVDLITIVTESSLLIKCWNFFIGINCDQTKIHAIGPFCNGDTMTRIPTQMTR